jgi:hypothetical protein
MEDRRVKEEINVKKWAPTQQSSSIYYLNFDIAPDVALIIKNIKQPLNHKYLH